MSRLINYNINQSLIIARPLSTIPATDSCSSDSSKRENTASSSPGVDSHLLSSSRHETELLGEGCVSTRGSRSGVAMATLESAFAESALIIDLGILTLESIRTLRDCAHYALSVRRSAGEDKTSYDHTHMQGMITAISGHGCFPPDLRRVEGLTHAQREILYIWVTIGELRMAVFKSIESQWG